jgi:hypothetical protein
MVFLIIATNLQSQIYLGLSTGISASKIHFDDESLQKNFRPIQKFSKNFIYDINSELYFGQVLNLNISATYLSKGFDYEQTYVKGYKHLRYIEIQTAGQIDINPDDKLIFSPYIGTYAAYWLSGERRYFDYKNNIYLTDSINFGNDSTFRYNRYDLGIIGGIDIKFPQKRNKKIIISGIRYEQGMISTDIEKVNGWKNRTFIVYLRYIFKL